MPQINFFEKQYFRQWWLFLIILPAPMVMAAVIFQQIVRGSPVGQNPAPDLALILISVFVLLSSILIFFIRLDTQINETGIHFRLFPFHIKMKHYHWNDISEIYVRKYNPIGEYGGWGIKGSKKFGKAYNVNGNMGLQIILKNGSKILLGTNKPVELEKVIESVKKKYLLTKPEIL